MNNGNRNYGITELIMANHTMLIKIYISFDLTGVETNFASENMVFKLYLASQVVSLGVFQLHRQQCKKFKYEILNLANP